MGASHSTCTSVDGGQAPSKTLTRCRAPHPTTHTYCNVVVGRRWHPKQGLVAVYECHMHTQEPNKAVNPPPHTHTQNNPRQIVLQNIVARTSPPTLTASWTNQLSKYRIIRPCHMTPSDPQPTTHNTTTGCCHWTGAACLLLRPAKQPTFIIQHSGTQNMHKTHTSKLAPPTLSARESWQRLCRGTPWLHL
jgi:hypothetical protein